MAERKTERPSRTNATHALAVTREWSCLLRRRGAARRAGGDGTAAAPRRPAPHAARRRALVSAPLHPPAAMAAHGDRLRGSRSLGDPPPRAGKVPLTHGNPSRRRRPAASRFPALPPLRAARARVRVLPGEVTPPLSPGRPETAGALAGRLGAGFMVMNRPRPFAAYVKCTQIRLCR